MVMNSVDQAQPKRKACTRCATAKAKCSFRSIEEGCDRCRRLRRECIVEGVPRRKREKQSTRVKALEEKVDMLLTILGPNAAVDTRRTPAPTEDNCSPICRSTPITVPSTTTKQSRRFDVIDDGLLSMSRAHVLLSKFKRVHSKFFPFVTVATDIDTITLRAEAPFLFLAVMTVCLEGDHLLQRRLGVEMKKVLAERVIVGNERNMDLLQGLLIQLGWSHFHFNPMNKQLHILLRMAVSLVDDLELDRCPAHRDQRLASDLCCRPMFANMLAQSKLTTQCRRTSAEIRALLGCFYLSSSMAMMRKVGLPQ